jgi:hypothetical protein
MRKFVILSIIGCRKETYHPYKLYSRRVCKGMRVI